MKCWCCLITTYTQALRVMDSEVLISSLKNEIGHDILLLHAKFGQKMALDTIFRINEQAVLAKFRNETAGRENDGPCLSVCISAEDRFIPIYIIFRGNFSSKKNHLNLRPLAQLIYIYFTFNFNFRMILFRKSKDEQIRIHQHTHIFYI